MTYDEIYDEKNGNGEGFSIGEDTDKIGEAALAQDWEVVERISISLILASDNKGQQYLVGGDGVGRSPWAITI